jgi:penicillin-binding protein 2
MLHRHRIKNYQQETKIFQHRLFQATIIILLLIFILLGRLAYLQFFSHKYYSQLATHNQLEMFAIEPNRGLIYDRNGVLLAENTPIFTLSIIPDYIKNIDATINELKLLVTLDDKSLRQFYKALKQHQKFEHVPLKYKLTQNEVENVYANQFRFPGVVIDANMVRHYPLGDTTANIIGYIGKANTQDLKNSDLANYTINSFIGKIGIEKYYEKILRGVTGHQQVEIDAAGHIIHQLKSFKPTPGDNLYLTIDNKLQTAATEALGKERGAVVVIDPNNGEILALVSSPSYDPNLFAYGIDQDDFQKLQNSPDKPMFNRTIRGIFPIASTIKPFLAIEGLESGTIDTHYTINDQGWFKLPKSDYKFRDWQPYGHGKVNVTKAIIQSCDIFFYTLATKLGIEKIDSILNRFGFGQKTGIDLGEELSGVAASPKWKITTIGKPWQVSDTVLSGIGQGYMSTTPLQLANAVATLANKGLRNQPHLLLKRQAPSGTIIMTQLPKLPSIILKNKQNWETIINAMKNVVQSPTGTAHAHFGNDLHYTVAGKTGTAQLFHHRFNEENATFEVNNIPKRLRNHSLFIAFAPTDHPKIAIAVIVENSITAPIVARKVLDFILAPPPTTPPTPSALETKQNIEKNTQTPNTTTNKENSDQDELEDKN